MCHSREGTRRSRVGVRHSRERICHSRVGARHSRVRIRHSRAGGNPATHKQNTYINIIITTDDLIDIQTSTEIEIQQHTNIDTYTNIS